MPANAQPAEALPPDKPVNIEVLDERGIGEFSPPHPPYFCNGGSGCGRCVRVYRWIEDGPRDEMQPDPFLVRSDLMRNFREVFSTSERLLQPIR